MKKFFLLIALLGLIAQGTWADTWDGSTTSKPSWNGSAAVISSAAELAYIRDHWDDVAGLDGDKDFYELNYSLEADLDMTVKNWTPMGSKAYKGSFDGHGHTITYKIDNSSLSTNCQGLFEHIHSEGSVRHLRIDGYINIGNARKVGGICGENDGAIEDCWVTADIKTSHYSIYDADLGGIAGLNDDGTIVCCCMSGNVTNTGNNSGVGAIAGSNENSKPGSINYVVSYGNVIVQHKQDSKSVGDNKNTFMFEFNEFLWDDYKFFTKERAWQYVLCQAYRYPYTNSLAVDGRGEIECTQFKAYPGEVINLNVKSGTVEEVYVRDVDYNRIQATGSNIEKQFRFTMPARNVNIDVRLATTSWDDPTMGTLANPFVIRNNGQWDEFAKEVNNGRNFSGKYVKLATDIEVKITAGTGDHPFNGTFLGDGHTATVDFHDDDYMGFAVFSFINGATIKNLKVAGTVEGHLYSASIVGRVLGGSNRLENCVSTASIRGMYSIGGLVGYCIRGDLEISGCVFSGRLIANTGGASYTAKGVFIGWYEGNGTKTLNDCLYVMQDGQDTENFALAKGEGAITLTNCYQTTQAEYNKTLAPKRIAAEYTPETDEEGEEYDGLWANVYDVMPDYFGNLLEDYGFLKVYEGGLEYEGLYYVACISMEDHLDNSALIDLATDYIVDVSLSDQLFRKDNQWYTLCLPFDLDNFTGTPLEGATVKTLSSSSYDAGTNTLTMDFSDNLTAIEAGKPYIVKWTEGEDIIFPMFTGVTVSTDAADVQTTYADFIGTYNYIDYAEEDRSILLLIGDALEYPEEGAHNIACSAYFRLKEGLVAGEPLRIVMNFNETQGIETITNDLLPITNKVIKDGQIFILRGDKIYTITGTTVK